MEEQVRSVLEREGLARALLDCEDPRLARALLHDAGLDLEPEDIRAIGRGLRNSLFDADELDEDGLDLVAGGAAALETVAAAVSVLTALAGRIGPGRGGFTRWG